jgi:hypothetical protein
VAASELHDFEIALNSKADSNYCIHVETDEAADPFFDRMTVVCVSCLEEFINKSTPRNFSKLREFGHDMFKSGPALVSQPAISCAASSSTPSPSTPPKTDVQTASATDLIFQSHSDASITLGTVVTVGLRSAFEAFATTGQDLSNCEIVIIERSQDADAIGVDGTPISITFLAKMQPGKKGLGNANRLGRSVTYLISRKTGAIIKEYLSK